MRRRELITIATITVLTTTAAASPAQADWLLTPFAGISFGDAPSKEHFSYGGSFGWMNAGVIGLELDAAHAPDLLAPEGRLAVGPTDSNVATLMGNVIVGIPLGSPGIRPYVSGGAGLLRTSVKNASQFFDVSDNSFGVNLGAGLMTFATEHVGVRIDLRYFRSMQDADAGAGVDLDLGDFDFWRATLGATFRF